MRRPVFVIALAACVTAGGSLAHAVDQPPGERIVVRPADLPAPYATPSVANPPDIVRRPAGATLRVPAGFRADLFAEGLGNARNLAVAPNGDVFLAELADGRVTILRDAAGTGRASQREVFVDGLVMPYGIAFREGAVYIADLAAVWRYPYRPGDTKPAGPRVEVTPDGALGSADGHFTRNIVFSPDGDRFYVAIGSRGNLGEEPAPRATVTEFHADGSGARTFASGLRNAVGIAFYPGTTDLYVVVNERDGLGDGLVPDFLTRVRDGDFYGWPYAYTGRHPQPGPFGQRRPDLVAKTLVPDVLFRSHSAPLGLAFYTGTQFPAEYRGDAFVTLHGSWNASQPTGYDVVRVPFRDRRPVGHYEIFASGFWLADERRARVWGRPVGIAVGKDGSLLVADDAGRTVWRISYSGP